MSVTQEAVNILVWRYMKESGFHHAAFLFESESQMDTSGNDVQQIPSVALVTYLQKALRYMENEKVISHARYCPESTEYKTITDLESRFPEPVLAVDEAAPQTPRSDIIQLSPSVATVLASHRLTVYCCKFSPIADVLATASSDGTVILWDMEADNIVGHKVLGKTTDFPAPLCDISCIDWSPDGKYLAAGSFDTHVRVYESNGTEAADLVNHTHYVFVVKFNKSGTRMVTAGSDKTITVWSIPGFVRTHTFDFHTDTVVDISWRDDNVFATASTDSIVGVCHIDGTFTRRTGHVGDVYAVAFNTSGSLLASGGQDGIVRLWSDNSPDAVALAGHDSGVSAMKWVPESDSFLVTGAVDGTIRVWDAINRFCVRVMEYHMSDIYSLSISPDGKYIASGSKDHCIVIGSIDTGEQIVKFFGNSGVYDVSFDRTGKYLSAGFEDATVVVIPARAYL